jgi:hypothetical protein
MDEKKFAMSIADSFKVLVRHTERQAFSVQAGNQDWVSFIECVCFNDNVLSLTLSSRARAYSRLD